MKRIMKYMSLTLLALAATACDHKDLLSECRSSMRVNVVFDWSDAPSANVGSMALYLYPEGGGAPLRYMFQNSRGGEITVPFGNYTALCMNNDNTDWAMVDRISDIRTFEILSEPAAGLSMVDLHNAGAETETADTALVTSPQLIWTDAGEGLSLSPDDVGDKTLTLYPQESGCLYTIDIYDIANADALESNILLATFSGLAGGYHPALQQASEEKVAMPLTMTVSDDGTKIHGEFVNFGHVPDIIYKNELRLYYFLSDGTAMAYSFDVTDQAHNAPDPRNVHIVLRGLPIPSPIRGGGGLKPVVDDWLEEHITIPMSVGS